MQPMVQVLHALPAMNHPDLLAGHQHAEDACVWRLADGVAIVQSVDFFPPLVDDPYVFGQIAAANSLSDVYAMGGEPLVALNIVGFPDDKLDLELLGRILRGGADKAAEAGVVIGGGHSVRDAEIKYGLVVTGRVHPDRFIRNGGARPGDRLLLTKPIGSGVLTTAAKRGRIKPEELAEAVAVMTTLNRSACDAMIKVGVHAATDITGFGLIGHAFEMAEASDVTIVLEAGAVPLMGRTLELGAAGCVTRAHKSTLAHLGTRLSSGGVDDPLVNVLADAQTSGGLLMSLPPGRVDAFLSAYGKPPPGLPAPAVVGHVEPASSVRIRLV